MSGTTANAGIGGASRRSLVLLALGIAALMLPVRYSFYRYSLVGEGGFYALALAVALACCAAGIVGRRPLGDWLARRPAAVVTLAVATLASNGLLANLGLLDLAPGRVAGPRVSRLLFCGRVRAPVLCLGAAAHRRYVPAAHPCRARRGGCLGGGALPAGRPLLRHAGLWAGGHSLPGSLGGVLAGVPSGCGPCRREAPGPPRRRHGARLGAAAGGLRAGDAAARPGLLGRGVGVRAGVGPRAAHRHRHGRGGRAVLRAGGCAGCRPSGRLPWSSP